MSNREIAEPSEDYIRDMMYVLESYSTGLSDQDMFDITKTLILSGFFTGIEECTGLNQQQARVPRGTPEIALLHSPSIKTESDYESELGNEHTGPFTEAIEERERLTRDAQSFDYTSQLKWD